jgi:formate dehydrogenase major subunit
LCVKGRYGFDYVQHKHRLTTPLIRKTGAPKHKDFTVDPEKWHEVFREATWEEALDFAAKGLRDIRDTYGKRALAGFGSAKGTNEEAYLFQKLVRTGFGSNNVDHCTRLCHASSVAALMEGINSGAVSNQVRDVVNSEVIFVIGANPTVNHPVAATSVGTRPTICSSIRIPMSRSSTRCSTSSSRKGSSTRSSSRIGRRATPHSPRT